MAVEGVDYSKSHPTPAQLKAAGKRFAVRYLTGTTSASPGGKNLTPTEAAALRAAGIAIVSNVETTGGFLLDGYDATAKLAEACWRQHRWCGGPDGRPLIFSLDFNATLNQYKTALQSLKGAGSAVGWEQVGMYGGLEQVDWAAQDGVKWLWQTYAWSYGQWSKNAKIQQYHNGVTLGSGLVDLDRALAADYGQWGTGDNMSAEDVSAINAHTDEKFAALTRALTVKGTVSLAETTEKLYGHAKGAHIDTGKILTALEQVLDPTVLAQLLAGALEITGISTTPTGVVTVTFGPKEPAA